MHLDPPAVVCPFELLPLSMDVRYHYGDVLVVVAVCLAIVVVIVGLVVSRILSICGCCVYN